MTTRRSAFYEGDVRHARFAPTKHAFRYRVAYAYLDLDEVPALFRADRRFATHPLAIAWLRREDHHGPSNEPLSESIRKLVHSRVGFRPEGPIRLLTFLRYLGIGMNPVSFYYCFGDEERLEAIVAEVNNTPWEEQHCYVFDVRALVASGQPLRFRFGKAFHVSPFNAMTDQYDWRFSIPGEDLEIEMHNEREGRAFFTARLRLRRLAWSRSVASGVLLRHPLMPLEALAAIYLEAFRLYRKGTPYHEHPKHALERAGKRGGSVRTTHEVRS